MTLRSLTTPYKAKIMAYIAGLLAFSGCGVPYTSLTFSPSVTPDVALASSTPKEIILPVLKATTTIKKPVVVKKIVPVTTAVSNKPTPTTTPPKPATPAVKPPTTTTNTPPAPTTPTPTTATSPHLGSCPIFPADNAWNTDISSYPVHPRSDAYIATINNMGSRTKLHPDFGGYGQYGMPFNIVSKNQTLVPITYGAYANQSEPGPFPIPSDAKVQPGEDKHLVIVDKDNCKLYEMYHAEKNADNSWTADSGDVWDLRSNANKPYFKTTSNAAGTPIYPGVIKYDEVMNGAVNHAIRFTVPVTYSGFILPATHYNDNNHLDPALPPLGLRVRLKDSYDISNFPPQTQVILTAMKKYGMILVQNGSAWAFGGEQDPRWDENQLRPLKSVPGDAFEVIYTGEPITRANQ